MGTMRMPVRHGEPSAPMRRAVRELLVSWAPEPLGDVLVVVAELVQNVTQHTGGDGELVLTATHADVLVEVSDADRSLPSVQPPDPSRPGGRGLLLVDGIALDWGCRPHPLGKVVWARIDARGSG